MEESPNPSATPAACFCSECGRKLSAHWKFCAGCGQSVSEQSVSESAAALDILLRATAAAKAARSAPAGVGERTAYLTRASDGAGLHVADLRATDLNVTLLGTPRAALEAEQAYLRGLEAARAFERSRRLPPPRHSDYPPALIVLVFALITALAIFAVFLFVQHF